MSLDGKAAAWFSPSFCFFNNEDERTLIFPLLLGLVGLSLVCSSNVEPLIIVGPRLLVEIVTVFQFSSMCEVVFVGSSFKFISGGSFKHSGSSSTTLIFVSKFSILC